MSKPIYDESTIQRLTPQEHIRLRPGMYVGGTDSKSLHHLVFEVMVNAIEEAMANKCSEIVVTICKNGEISISDNSQGIPVTVVEGRKESTLELYMTMIGTGGRHREFNHFYVLGSLYGVGLPAVNALCSNMTVEVRRDGFLWRQSYREGVTQTPLEQVRPLEADESTGNMFTFTPDFTILDANEFDYDTIAERCREVSYTVSGLKIVLRDERTESIREEIFQASAGIQEWVAQINHGKEAYHPIIYEEQTFLVERFQRTPYRVKVEVAYQYIAGPEITLLSFANTARSEGGTHVMGFKRAILDRARSHTQTENSWDEVAQGLTAIVSIFHSKPAFESIKRVKLLNPEMIGLVTATVMSPIVFSTQPANPHFFPFVPDKKDSSA